MDPIFEIVLPIPPSANNCFREARSKGRTFRVKSTAYKKWEKKVLPVIAIAKRKIKSKGPLVSHCRTRFEVNINYQSDIANREKPVHDALEKSLVLENDAYVEDFGIRRTTDLPPGQVRVKVWPHEPVKVCTKCKTGGHLAPTYQIDMDW